MADLSRSRGQARRQRRGVGTAARHLMERYPDIPDREAVTCYRRVLEIINRTSDDFDPEFTQRFEDQIAKLNQPQAT